MVEGNRVIVLIILAFAGVLFLTGCSGGDFSLSIQPTPAGAHPVDPVFREFYQQLGGEPILGAAISPLFEDGFVQCQYTVNALMCYNPQDSGASRFYLAPLGRKMGLSYPPDVNADPNQGLVVNGYTIGPDFVDLYRKISSARQAGSPLSGVIYNYNQQRTEQFFENVGFYHRFDDPPGVSHLLPYGKYICGDLCNAYQSPITLAIPQSGSQLGVPFAYTVERLGGERDFGRPLSRAFYNEDGVLEQVYETVVFTAAPDNPTQIRLKPITRLLGMFALPPAPFNPEQRNVVFYPVTPDGLGYHVPVEFDRFIVQHGGVEISGNPIADVLLYSEENTIRQCYENYCLDYYPSAAQGYRVRLAPLGSKYLELIDPSVIAPGAVLPEKLVVTISEARAQLAPGEVQRIYVLVTEETSQTPVANATATLTVTVNGMQYTYAMPPTGENGISSIEIAPIQDLPNGTVVSYSVCLDTSSGNSVCSSDSYLIWATGG